MVPIIVDKAKKLWEIWDLRVLILFSLSLQAVLILFATFRKRSASRCVIFCIWSAYLLADWVAAVTVGLISHGQGDNPSGDQNVDLLAIWASFLLLHLGGPDTITSFSLEDNELWLRHLFGVILQVGAAVYIFLQSLQKNKVWFPTMLVLVAGTIKYAERTCALYLASLAHLGDSVCRKPNPGPEYKRFQQMYKSLRLANLPVRRQAVKGPNEGLWGIKYKPEEDLKPSNEKSLLRDAFRFFETFKGLIPGLLLSSEDRQVSRDFFLNKNANDAFKLIEIELSLMYEVLHTKVVVVRGGGYFFRFISFISVPVALLAFCLADKKLFHDVDVKLTYILFGGALILEALSLLKLLLLDRTVISLVNWLGKDFVDFIIRKRRWSESVYQCNFMSYFLKDFRQWTKTLAEFFQVGNLLDKLKIMILLLSHKNFNEESMIIKQFIFNELRVKSIVADNKAAIEKICSSRGDCALRSFSDDELKRRVQRRLTRMSTAQEEVRELSRSVQDVLNRSVEDELRQSLQGRSVQNELKQIVQDSGVQDEDELKRIIQDRRDQDEHKQGIFQDEILKQIVQEWSDQEELEGIAQNWRDHNRRIKQSFQDELIKRSVLDEVIKGGTVEDKLKWSVQEVEYAESLLMWHIATDLCIHQKNNPDNTSKLPKLLSDYAFYLILTQPTIMAPILGNWQIIFQDTYADAKRFFPNHSSLEHSSACDKMLKIEADIEPGALKGDTSKSVFIDACILAKKLSELEDDQWELMSKVWLELLCYAALNCRANVHAQQPSRGGELLTLIWLLMNHFGLGNMFYEANAARIELIVRK